MKRQLIPSVLLLAAGAAVSACGGSHSSTTPPGSTGTISGAVVLGPVSGASVRAYAVSGGTMGAQIGGGTTDAAGRFTISIGHHAGPVMLQASGGSYVDEATGITMGVGAGDELACAIPSVAADATTTGIQVTPLTSMAHARVHHMAGGITDATIAAANTAVADYFATHDILHTAPMDPTAAGAGASATQDARNAGLAIAAMSRYAHDVGMTTSSALVTALMSDASDGTMDGTMGGTPVAMGGGMMAGTAMAADAGSAGLATAMAAFIGSPMNRSGVTAADMQAVMAQLAAAAPLPGAGGGSTSGMLSGAAVKGPIAGAAVTAYAIEGGLMGAQLGTTQTDAEGSYTVSLGSYAGPVMLQLSGGSYGDEATGTTMPMMAGDRLYACLDGVAAGATTAGIQLTPLTAMAHARSAAMAGGMTPANITAANAAVGAYFSVGDILRTRPMDPTAAGSGAGATQDQRNYGMVLAAMSQEAMALGMTASSSGMVTAMMDDATDGVMDGMMGGATIPLDGMGGMMGGMMQPTAGTSGLATAMEDFIGSPMNRSGVALADMQPLMEQLGGSTGVLPGAGGMPSPHGILGGTAFMGGMSGGTVSAYAVSGGTMGPMIGSASVGADGTFTIPMGAYAGTVMLQLAGGSFMDEATGSSMTMQAGDVMTACVPAMTAGGTMTGLVMTPMSSMAQMMAQYMAGGMTATSCAATNAGVGSYFMTGDVLTTMPMDPSQAGSGAGASQDARDYGMSIAAMSQYAQTMGMTGSSSGMMTAFMKDASDGTMDGMMGATRITMTGMGGGMGGGGMGGGSMMQSGAGTAGLSTAMATFAGSAMNHSGLVLTDVQPLVTKLGSSSGAIP